MCEVWLELWTNHVRGLHLMVTIVEWSSFGVYSLSNIVHCITAVMFRRDTAICWSSFIKWTYVWDTRVSPIHQEIYSRLYIARWTQNIMGLAISSLICAPLPLWRRWRLIIEQLLFSFWNYSFYLLCHHTYKLISSDARHKKLSDIVYVKLIRW
jgi:hypothetical protein